jgi:4-aminobutyrate aminotransferase-like enzyme/Ser/Thr protein kinase RdoA (MazF antagonist)
VDVNTVNDAVLAGATPRFGGDAIAELVAGAYGVEGRVLGPLNSERDQVVQFGNADPGGRQLVVKISNAAETPANIDLEESAALWAVAAEPGLPLSTPRRLLDGTHHTVVRNADTGEDHFLRAYDVLPGRAGLIGSDLEPHTVYAYGVIAARMSRALRGFFHPAAGRRLLWHVEEKDRTRQLAIHIDDAATRSLVEAAFDGFDARVAPVWSSLRAQAVHSDLTLDNLLVDDDGEVTGILDLGDLAHSTLVSDIAAVFGSLAATLSGDALFRTLRRFLDGYRSVTPLEPEELAALGDTIAVRAAITLCISNWRAADHPENAAYIRAWDEMSLSLLTQFAELGPEAVTRRLGGPTPPPDNAGLRRRRDAVFGDALAELTYDDPVHLLRGSGATLTDTSGRTYVDAYNNVPVVGHAHPRVSGAIADQARLLAINLRYLHPRAIELGERLVATMPPGVEGLDTVLLLNSGSEATDLAWRLATAATGRTGALVTDFAYHGVTTAANAFSPEEWRGGWRPGHVERFAAPVGPDPGTQSFTEALGRLDAAGHEPALVIVDPAYTSDGIHAPGPAYHQELAVAARSAGALVVADEVQAGFGRAGDHLWSFAGAGLVPDVVTLGKPMGNGHPIAAVITRRSYVEALGRQAEFFSTFAGSPVAAVAALAVLDVIDDDDLVSHAGAMGRLLHARLRERTRDCRAVREIRGRGLLMGVDLGGTPPAVVSQVVDRVRDLGVLVGTTGPTYDVLKIRPPLAITAAQVTQVADAVGTAISEIADC